MIRLRQEVRVVSSTCEMTGSISIGGTAAPAPRGMCVSPDEYLCAYNEVRERLVEKEVKKKNEKSNRMQKKKELHAVGEPADVIFAYHLYRCQKR